MSGETDVMGTRSPLGSHHLSFASWNSRALFASHYTVQRKAKHKLRIYKILCTKHVAVTAQEAHGSTTDRDTFAREIPTHEHFPSTLDSAAGGVSISVQSAFFRSRFHRHHIFELILGRVACLRALRPEGNLTIVAVRIVPEMNDTQLVNFFDVIDEAMQPAPNTLKVLIGDLNCHPADEPRLIVGGDAAEFSSSN